MNKLGKRGEHSFVVRRPIPAAQTQIENAYEQTDRFAFCDPCGCSFSTNSLMPHNE